MAAAVGTKRSTGIATANESRLPEADHAMNGTEMMGHFCSIIFIVAFQMAGGIAHTPAWQQDER